MSDSGLVVAGAAGRMGRTLISLIAETEGVTLVGAMERTGSPRSASMPERWPVGPARRSRHRRHDRRLASADGVIDFSTPEATALLASAAAIAGVVDIIGTTGLAAADNAAIDAAAERTAIVQSGNMSLGVNLLAQFVRQAARALDSSFDIEILEMHHRHKVDAPSGTALLFGRAAAEGRDIDLESHSVRVRDGQVGARRTGDIGFAALRGGTTVGDHSVIFAGEGETVELTHRAFDRAIFARGAVKAALWAKGRPPGRYTMADVLGLNTE